MRISTSQMFHQSVNAILDQQANANKTQLQLGAGKRILTAADDPAASATALSLRQRLGQVEQYQTNIRFARSRVSLEESTLNNANNTLQQVRELTVTAGSGALVQQDRIAISQVLSERLNELIDLANTRDGSGEYLFSGFQGQTRPFSGGGTGTVIYNGDQGQRQIQIGTDHRVAVSDSGYAVFQAVRNGNGTFSVSPNTANQGTGVIDPGTVSDPTAYDGDTYSVIMGHQTTATGGAIGITDTGVNDALQYELRINGTLVDTLNEGDSRTLAQLETAITAQSGVTGVRGYVDGGTLYLANTTPSGNAITVSETLTGATEDTDTVTGFFGANLTGLVSTSSTTTFDPEADAYVVLDSANNIETSGTYAENAAIVFNGVSTSVNGTPDNGDTFTVAPSVNQDLFVTMRNLISDIQSFSGAELQNALNRALVDLDRGLENIDRVRADLGARLNTIDSQEVSNEDFTMQLRTTLSTLEDLDYAEASSRLNQQLLALQAAQQAFIRVQGLTLFNFLR